MGDLNINYNKRNNQKELKNIISYHGLEQLIDRPTRITINTSTLIDIIITTDTSKNESNIVINNSLSDHNLIGAIHKQHVGKFRLRKVFVMRRQ